MPQVMTELVPAPAARLLTRPRAGMSLDQERLASRIERHVRRQTNDKVRDLRVEVGLDGVVLQGRCGTFYTKQLAQHAAMTAVKDVRLFNQIEVW